MGTEYQLRPKAMNDHPMMKCGCAAQGVLSARGGVKIDPPIPSCLVHDCTEIADSPPDLSGRIAVCAYLPHGYAPKPSSNELAFFEYHGPGSAQSSEICKCGMHKVAHDKNGRIAKQSFRGSKGCVGFVSKGPDEFDRYYCGCHGWD